MKTRILKKTIGLIMAISMLASIGTVMARKSQESQNAAMLATGMQQSAQDTGIARIDNCPNACGLPLSFTS